MLKRKDLTPETRATGGKRTIVDKNDEIDMLQRRIGQLLHELSTKKSTQIMNRKMKPFEQS